MRIELIIGYKDIQQDVQRYRR